MSDSPSSKPKSHPRVTSTIRRWFDSRWRVDVALDGRNVRKAYFDDYAAALAGATEMEQQVIVEAKLQ